MVGIFRWFLGWSEVRLQGDVNGLINRFRENIWLVTKQGEFLTFRCMTKDFKKISNEAIYYSCFLTKNRDCGFLNFLRRYRFRSGIFIGILVFFLAIFISNFFVWDVVTNGNVIVSDEDILRVCSENGLCFGGFIGNVNEQNIEFKLKEKYPEISWVSLNRIAGKYIVEINESDKKPDIQNFEGLCDVISTHDGEILYIEGYGGTIVVEVGDIVQKGQVLVTSIEEKEDQDEVIYSNADAKIIAKVYRQNEVSCKTNSIVDQKTGIKKFEKKLCLFGFDIPISINRKKDKTVKNKDIYEPLEFLGIRLPFLIKTTVYDVYEPVPLEDDIEKIKRVLVKQQKEWELKNLMGNKILSRDYNFEKTGDEVILKAGIFVEQRIDKKVPISLEEVSKEDNNFEE